jgi:hypothetical protein
MFRCYDAFEFVRLTFFGWTAPIAGSLHDGLAPAPLLVHLSATIVLGGQAAVNSFQSVHFREVMASQPTNWFWRHKPGIPRLASERQLSVASTTSATDG